MNRVSLFFLALTCAARVTAAVSTGGSFSLDSSLANAGGQSATGGTFTLAGSIGAGFHPTNSKGEPLKAAFKRMYSGFLGVAPLVDPTKTNLLVLSDGNIQMEIPAGAFSQPYDPMIEINPFSFPISGDSSSTLPDATQTLLGEFGSNAGPLSICELRILLGDGTLFSGEMSQPLNAGMNFAARDDGGQAWLYRWDDVNKEWIKDAAISTLNSANFFLNQAGIIAIFQFPQGPSGTGAAYAYPVPWRPHSNNPAAYGTSQDGITFAGIPASGVIGIYSVDGELIRDLVIPPGSVKLQWDGKTGSGNDLASGIYIWSVQSPDGNRKIGKLMIIR